MQITYICSLHATNLSPSPTKAQSETVQNFTDNTNLAENLIGLQSKTVVNFIDFPFFDELIDTYSNYFALKWKIINLSILKTKPNCFILLLTSSKMRQFSLTTLKSLYTPYVITKTAKAFRILDFSNKTFGLSKSVTANSSRNPQINNTKPGTERGFQ